MLKSVALHNELMALEREQKALSFFETKAGDSPAKNRETAQTYSVANVLRGKPGRTERMVSDRLTDVNGSIFNAIDLTEIQMPLSAIARDLSVLGGAGLGIESVQTSVAPSIIPVLRNNATVIKAGATVLENLRGNPTIARQATTVAPTWAPETLAVTPGSQDFTFDLAGTLKPNRAQETVIASRQLVVQSSVDIMKVVGTDLVRSMSIAVDLACLVGAGISANQPTGIFNWPSVPTTSFGSGNPQLAKVLSFENLIENANIEDDGTFAFITSPNAKTVWKQTLKGSSQAKFLWDDDNTVAGHRAFSTRQLASAPFKTAQFSGDSLI
jgi:HK97 family phage major capsid protein